MREFYHRLPAGGRPKIFGMTASPIKAKGESSLWVMFVLVCGYVFAWGYKKARPLKGRDIGVCVCVCVVDR